MINKTSGWYGLNALRVYALIAIIIISRHKIFYGCFLQGGGIFKKTVPFHFDVPCLQIGIIIVTCLLFLMWLLTAIIVFILKTVKIKPSFHQHLLVVSMVSAVLLLLTASLGWIG